MKVLFLDIDGVLNGHQFNRKAQSGNIRKACIRELSRIVETTGCKIVLSSAWRYMIHGRAMTLLGFQYMLRTHGLVCMGKNLLIDVTIPDEVCPRCDKRHKGMGRFDTRRQLHRCEGCNTAMTRGAQIAAWLRKNRRKLKVKRYAVVDDEDYNEAMRKHPFVQTDGAVGLTREKADEIIAMLGIREIEP